MADPQPSTAPTAFILNREIVAAWIKEREQIQAKVAELMADADSVQHKLSAAKLLAPGLFTPKEAPVPKADKTVLEGIVQLLTVSGLSLTPKQIRESLDRDTTVARASENYLYTALKRGLERGFLVKDGEGYAVPQPRLEGLGSAGA